MIGSFNKEFLRSITRGAGRFVAIAIIAALGTGFYAGLRMTAPDMKMAGDVYYDGTHFSDLRVVSTLGMDEEMADRLAAIPGVEAVQLERETDVLADIGGVQYVTRVHALDAEQANASDTSDGVNAVSDDAGYLNRPILIEGEWPDEPGECVLAAGAVLDTVPKIGDTVRFVGGVEDLDDTFAVTEYKVVGFARSAYYVYTGTFGATTLGGGMVDEYLYVTHDSFVEDFPYTGAFVTVKGARDLPSSSDAYDRAIDPVVASIESDAQRLAAMRLASVKADAQAELDDAQAEYEEERADAESQLADAEGELADAAAELDDAAAELADAETTLNDSAAQLGDAKAELDSAAAELADAKAELDSGAAELADAKAELDSGGAELTDSKAQLDAAEQELAASKQQLDDAAAQIADGQEQLDASAAKLAEGEQQLAAAQQEYDAGVAQLAEQKAAAEQQLADGQAQIDAGRAAIAEGVANLDAMRAGVAAADAGIAEGQAQIQQLQGQQAQLAEQVAGAYAQADALDAQAADLEAQAAAIRADDPESEQAAALDVQAAALREQAVQVRSQADAAQAQLEQLSAGIAQAQEQVAAAQAQRDELAGQIAAVESAQAQLDAAQAELDAQRAQAQEQFAAAQAQLDDAKAQIDTAGAQLADGRAQYEQGAAELDAARQQYESGKELYDQGAAQYETGKSAYEQGLQKYEDGVAAYEDGVAKWEDGNRQYQDGLTEYADGLAKYEDGQRQYQDGLAEYADGKQQYEDGLAEYQDGLAEYESKRQEADDEFADAEAELADAQADIDALEPPDIYVLDRTKNVGAASFDSDSDRIDRIARVFPFIFFLVAALVSLTTMTRMVDEERQLIGTYKALGFGNARIASKYLLYALLASGVGSVIGVAILTQFLPWFIMDAYSIVYEVPVRPTPIDPGITAFAMALGIGITMAATGAAAASSLRETPASLMLPRAPKAGKRILLERIRPVWSRMSFLWKVTARNIFRYKRRFFMAVVGVAGCTALLLTGFGLHNSVNDIIDKHYGPIAHFEVTVRMDEDASEESKQAAEQELSNPDLFAGHVWLSTESVVGISPEGKEYRLELTVPQDVELFQSDFMALRERRSQEPIRMDGSGAVIAEKLARVLGVGVGDTLRVYDQDEVGNAIGSGYDVVISGVMESYTGQSLLVTPEYYRSVFGGEPEYRTACAKLAESVSGTEQVSQRLLDIDGVSTVEDIDDAIGYYRTALKSVNSVVVILIIAAALLAFVVLYNLTNINITERQREIATLKVLGFTPREVDAYIYRETMILALIGALCGLVLGIWMEGFVVTTAEVDQVMFGRDIHALSFVWAFALTMVFAALVSIFMRAKLKAISMVESLKSVE